MKNRTENKYSAACILIGRDRDIDNYQVVSERPKSAIFTRWSRQGSPTHWCLPCQLLVAAALVWLSCAPTPASAAWRSSLFREHPKSRAPCSWEGILFSYYPQLVYARRFRQRSCFLSVTNSLLFTGYRYRRASFVILHAEPNASHFYLPGSTTDVDGEGLVACQLVTASAVNSLELA